MKEQDLRIGNWVKWNGGFWKGIIDLMVKFAQHQYAHYKGARHMRQTIKEHLK